MIGKETLVTPSLAAEWLRRNTHQQQRPLRARRVEQWAHEMRAGRWQLTPQGVSFAPDGTLLDGQHRLAAVVASGVAVRMLVFTNVPDGAMQVIDAGAARTAADALGLHNREVAVTRALFYSVPVKQSERLAISTTPAVAIARDHYDQILGRLREWGLISTGVVNAAVAAQIGKAIYAGESEVGLQNVCAALRDPSNGEYPAINILRVFLVGRHARGAGAGTAVGTEVMRKTQRAVQASLRGERIVKLYAPDAEIWPRVPVPELDAVEQGVAA